MNWIKTRKRTKAIEEAQTAEQQAREAARKALADAAKAAARTACGDDPPVMLAVVAVWSDGSPIYSYHGHPLAVAQACDAVAGHLRERGLMALGAVKAERNEAEV